MERILSADHNTWNRHDPVFDHLISISEWTGSKTSSYWRQHFIKAVQMIYHTDTPTNVLPSIHVFNSLACCVAILKNQRKYKKSTDTACVVLTILIIMSTMFLKQHSVVDVVLAAMMYTGCYRIIYGNELWSQNAFRTSIFSDHS